METRSSALGIRAVDDAFSNLTTSLPQDMQLELLDAKRATTIRNAEQRFFMSFIERFLASGDSEDTMLKGIWLVEEIRLQCEKATSRKVRLSITQVWESKSAVEPPLKDSKAQASALEVIRRDTDSARTTRDVLSQAVSATAPQSRPSLSSQKTSTRKVKGQKAAKTDSQQATRDIASSSPRDSVTAFLRSAEQAFSSSPQNEKVTQIPHRRSSRSMAKSLPCAPTKPAPSQLPSIAADVDTTSTAVHTSPASSAALLLAKRKRQDPLWQHGEDLLVANKRAKASPQPETTTNASAMQAKIGHGNRSSFGPSFPAVRAFDWVNIIASVTEFFDDEETWSMVQREAIEQYDANMIESKASCTSETEEDGRHRIAARQCRVVAEHITTSEANTTLEQSQPTSTRGEDPSYCDTAAVAREVESMCLWCRQMLTDEDSFRRLDVALHECSKSSATYGDESPVSAQHQSGHVLQKLEAVSRGLNVAEQEILAPSWKYHLESANAWVVWETLVQAVTTNEGSAVEQLQKWSATRGRADTGREPDSLLWDYLIEAREGRAAVEDSIKRNAVRERLAKTFQDCQRVALIRGAFTNGILPFLPSDTFSRIRSWRVHLFECFLQAVSAHHPDIGAGCELVDKALRGKPSPKGILSTSTFVGTVGILVRSSNIRV